MSAEILRRAASLMRERAEAASEGKWFAVSGSVYTGTAAPHQTLAPAVTYYDDAEHIASWRPAVALAVADWLDAVSARYEALLDTFAPGSRAGAITASENVTGWTEALTVARIYLGESA